MKQLPPKFFTGQFTHFICLAILLGLAHAFWQTHDGPFPIAFWSAIGIIVGHHFFIWISWRSELLWELTSRTIGTNAYFIIFILFVIARAISFLWITFLDMGPPPYLRSNDLPLPLYILSGLPVWMLLKHLEENEDRYRLRDKIYLRVMGADHFKVHFKDYKIFAQGRRVAPTTFFYVWVALVFFGLSYFFKSHLSAVLSFVTVAYIFIHYHTIEKPDAEFIYREIEEYRGQA